MMLMFYTPSLRGSRATEAIHGLPRVLCTLAMTTLLVFPVLAAEKNAPNPAAIIAPYPPAIKTRFLTSCVGLHKEMIPACKCMILTFEKAVPLKDYLEIAKLEDPAQDSRFKNVASACLRRIQTTP